VTTEIHEALHISYKILRMNREERERKEQTHFINRIQTWNRPAFESSPTQLNLHKRTRIGSLHSHSLTDGNEIVQNKNTHCTMKRVDRLVSSRLHIALQKDSMIRRSICTNEWIYAYRRNKNETECIIYNSPIPSLCRCRYCRLSN